jgi:hypothetical protein
VRSDKNGVEEFRTMPARPDLDTDRQPAYRLDRCLQTYPAGIR